MTQLGKAFNELRSGAPMFIDDTPARNMLQITAIGAPAQAPQQDLGLIVVDYIQLVDSEESRDSRQEQIAKISRRLKTLARELEVPVIALSQLNRAVENREDRRPRMADLRESGAIEQDADIVLLLHRPDYYDANDQPGIAELIVAKNRNGAHRHRQAHLPRRTSPGSRTSPPWPSRSTRGARSEAVGSAPRSSPNSSRCSSPTGPTASTSHASIGWNRRSSPIRPGASAARSTWSPACRCARRTASGIGTGRARRLLADPDPCRDRIPGHGGAAPAPDVLLLRAAPPPARLAGLAHRAVSAGGARRDRLGRLRGEVLGPSAVSFEYAYVGLPGLDGEQYVAGEHLLGVALTALMRVPPARRAEVHAEALRRLAEARENDYRRYLLLDCLEAYATLDEAQAQELGALLRTERYQGAQAMAVTTFEKGTCNRVCNKASGRRSRSSSRPGSAR